MESDFGRESHVRGASGRRGGGGVVGGRQRKRLMEIENVEERVEREEGRGEDEVQEVFVPLRPALKRKSTGKEDNFMSSYYVEDNAVAAMSEEEVQRLRRQHGIVVDGDQVPRPIRSFGELSHVLPSEILNVLYEAGISSPTPIQMQAIPTVMSGRDVIGLAETGSGKTLAYLLPLVGFLRHYQPALEGDGPMAIILAPTRELAEQIYTETVRLLPSLRGASHLPFTALCAVGGVPLASQLPVLQRGVDVLVATPGRLIDLLNKNAVRFERLSYLVFDEADELLKYTPQTLSMEEQLRYCSGFS